MVAGDVVALCKVHSLEELTKIWNGNDTCRFTLVIVTNPCAYLHTLVKSATNLAISDKEDQLLSVMGRARGSARARLELDTWKGCSSSDFAGSTHL